MKRLYINAISFFILFAAIALLFDRFSLKPDSRMVIAEWTDSVSYLTMDGTSEVLPYFEKAGTSDGTTTLIIGDSVCHQLFNDLQEYNEDMTIIGSNGAVSTIGQYVLTSLYLDAHPDATDVYLFMLPDSLSRSFDTTYGYSYIILPLAQTGTLRLLDQDTLDIMAGTYGDFFVENRGIELIGESGLNRKLYLNAIQETGPGYEPEYPLDIADRYVLKINDLCTERGVRFHMIPCPVSDEHIDQDEAFREMYGSSQMHEIFPDYPDEVYYYPAEQAADGVHFSGDYALRESLNEKVAIITEGTGLELIY